MIHRPPGYAGYWTTSSNKRMQLTKLRAAPERQDKVPPCAPAGQMDGGTASQLIRAVRRLEGWDEETNVKDAEPSEVERHVRDFIRTKVAAGFRQLEEIAEEAVEIGAVYGPTDALRPIVPVLVQQYAAEHLKAQAEWPDETDCDRLVAAFEQLERGGILARQDFSCCGTCASAEIWDEIDSAREGGREVRGYAFYDMQDTDAAVDGHGLYLSYGCVGEGEAPALAIGHEIVNVLRDHGLPCEWDGTWETRISVQLDWKRRR